MATENVTIRIPIGLRDKMKEEAAKDLRSVNGYIVSVLCAAAEFTPSRPKPKGDEE